MIDFTQLEQFLGWQADLMREVIARTAWLLILIAMVAGLLVFFYWAGLGISGGLRRQERARCFITLLEIGLRQGRTIEQTILSLTKRRVREMGVFFHLLAAWLERGVRLSAALEEVPRFLPAQVNAMLAAGETIGDIGKVLPACRATLKDAASGALTGVNSLFTLLFVSPIGPLVVWFFSISVVPKFLEIGKDMGFTGRLPGHPFFQWGLWVGIVTTVAWLVFWLATLLTGEGNWLGRALGLSRSRLGQRFSQLVPWRRKRMQRDFSVMLGLALDSGVPEEQALHLAADSTASFCFQERAEKAAQALRQGAKLTDAVRLVDDSKEFQWRLTNAAASPSGFSSALAGWHESLEARAFQQEQVASQGITTSFVFLNGLMVGLTAIGVFQMLIAIIEVAAW